jgi:hypothetical protein
VTTFKPTGDDETKLREAAKKLKQSNALLAIGKKGADAAKECIEGWLKQERKFDVATLEIGDIVNIEGIVLIEVGKQNKFDEKAFLLAQPSLHEEWKRDMPVRKFKALI